MNVRRRRRSQRVGAALCGIALAISSLPGVPTPAAAASQCSTSVRSSYTVMLCFVTPQSDTVLIGDAPVSITVAVSGNDPGVQRVVATLDGEALLTDVAAPYDFQIPTTKYVDGLRILTAQVTLRDGYTSVPASIPVTFSNGITQPPVNTNTFTPHAPSGTHGRLVATGDGAGGRPESQAVSDSIAAMGPDLFLYLGDVYEKGTVTEMYNWYGHDGSFFNAFYDVTNPVIGNHEYENGSAPGYFDYWDNVPDYYSYDAFGWHLVALNSDSHFGEYGPGSGQYKWLAKDLAASSAACTLVYWHHPRFSVGPQGDTPEMQPIWQLAADSGVDVVLTGHDHSYQRWERLDGAGDPDPNGVLSFVVGAGGHGVQSFVGSDPRLAVGIDDNGREGSLRIDLNPAGAEFAYVTMDGTVLDATTMACSGGAPDVTAPTEPTQLTATAASGTQVDLSWAPSQDDVAVTAYTVYRDDVAVATVQAPATSYSDLFLDPDTMYSYRVDAVDAAGHHSTRSAASIVETPPAPTSYTFTADGDAYTNASKPTTNYGGATLLRLDGSPLMRSYIDFHVLGIVGTVQGATLRVWANSSSSTGFEVHTVPPGSWTESTLTAANAPPPGSLQALSGPLAAGTYVDIPLTADVISGDGEYSLALTPLTSSAISLASRESGTPAQLVVDVIPFGNAAPTAADLMLDAQQGVLATWTPAVDDVNGDPLTCTIGIAPTHGTATVAPDCSTGTYESDLGYEGPDSFTYVADDGPASDEGRVDVTVSTPQIYGPNPIGDAYVDASSPTSNFGSQTQLRTDSSPLIRSYLQFGVSPLDGPVISAKLRIYANSSLSAGFELHTAADGWDESTLTFENAPAVGDVVATSGPVTNNTWVELDVTSSIASAGLRSFAITPLSTTNLRLASRESANPPELVITQDTSGNSTPTAGDLSLAVTEDTPAAWTPDVSDPDQGDVLSCTIASAPSIGVASVAADCSSGGYTPGANLNGPDSFTYEVSDGSVTSIGTVTVQIAAVNDAPVAAAVGATTEQDVPVAVTLSAIDADGECPQTFEIASGPAAGSIGAVTNVQCDAGVASAEVLYTPGPGLTGADTFTYEATDPSATPSAPATVTIDVTAPVTTFVLNPLGDAYVDATLPDGNFGTVNQLRTDSSPQILSYVKFQVGSLSRPVASARLRIHANSNLSVGFEVRAVGDNGWTESTVTYSNAPAIGRSIAKSGPVSNNTWIEIDVSSFVTGSGTYSFALTPLSTTNLRLASRETATPPELIVDT